ncbi:tetratricopeptide repeat protein [Streptomyces sp. NPDC096132]|uniref:tetratricopeptide repeat protein n=1 Tax=Streptomyces sp. NPDC096132 TaxID=3366075 RepID=UPI00382FC94F
MSALFDRRAAADASGAGAIAAGGNIGQAFTGPGAVGLHIDHVGMLLPDACPPAESVECPPNLTNLPFRAELFVGRDKELGLLRGASATPGRPLVHVLHGLGGIGKSTLAARLASAHSLTGAPVWWITADSHAAIDSGLAGLASALKPSLVPLLPQEQLSEWGRGWLATHTGWLVVLDNVTNPDHVTPLLSRATAGRFLLTSQRATGWQGIAEEVPLSVLSGQDAVRLFTEIRGEDPDAAELCEELGNLPLAVTQAAAYCKERDCAVRTYLDHLAEWPAEMYAETQEGGDHERTVARVWHVTLDRLAADPLAVRILLTLAWYAPDAIPRSLFTSLGTSLAVHRALGRLAAHSLITFSAGDTVSVHRLVQAVSRTHSDGDRHRNPEAIADARTAAMDALARAVPEDIDDPSAWPVMRSLIPHAEALAQHVPSEDDTAAMARLLARTGDYMLGAGVKVARGAFDLLRRAETACVRHHGLEAEDTLVTRVLSAQATRMLRSVEEAAPFAEEVLADCGRVLGPDHEATLLAMTNLHRVASLQGETERALRLAEDCLAARVRLLGKDDRRIFEARHDVVMALTATGDLARARGLCEELLADCLRALGKEHPVTLVVRGRVTMLASMRALPASLIQLMSGVVAVAEGDEKNLVTVVRHMVEKAGVLGAQQFTPATKDEVSAAERDLETCRRVLGDDHPVTVSARLVLLQVYGAAQDERYADATVSLLWEVFSLLSENESVITPMLRMFEALRTVVDELPPKR